MPFKKPHSLCIALKQKKTNNRTLRTYRVSYPFVKNNAGVEGVQTYVWNIRRYSASLRLDDNNVCSDWEGKGSRPAGNLFL